MPDAPILNHLESTVVIKWPCCARPLKVTQYNKTADVSWLTYECAESFIATLNILIKNFATDYYYKL